MAHKRKECCSPLPPVSMAKYNRGISISYRELGILCAATKHVPQCTPKRWDLISTIVCDCVNNENEIPLASTLQLHIQETEGVKYKNFDKSPSCCKEAVRIICSKYKQLFDDSLTLIQDTLISYVDKTALKRIILLPPVKECCAEPILIRNRPSFPLVFTTQGTFVAALFSGECRRGCSKKFSHSYYHQGEKLHYFNPGDSEYFHISTQTIFSTYDITNNIAISATSFQSRAEVYNENFRKTDHERLINFTDFGRSSSDLEHPWKLTEKRVEDAWFMFALVSYYCKKKTLDNIDFHTDSSRSQRSDLDALCGSAWEAILDDTNPWIHHKCKVKKVI